MAINAASPWELCNKWRAPTTYLEIYYMRHHVRDPLWTLFTAKTALSSVLVFVKCYLQARYCEDTALARTTSIGPSVKRAVHPAMPLC